MRILIVLEGERTEPDFFQSILQRFELNAELCVVGTNLYTLYHKCKEYFGSFANVGVVKSICKQVQTAAYQGSNHGISATGGFTSHGYSCRNRVSFVN